MFRNRLVGMGIVWICVLCMMGNVNGIMKIDANITILNELNNLNLTSNRTINNIHVQNNSYSNTYNDLSMAGVYQKDGIINETRLADNTYQLGPNEVGKYKANNSHLKNYTKEEEKNIQEKINNNKINKEEIILSYGSPRMEMCADSPIENQAAEDGYIWITVTVKYWDESTNPLWHPLKYVEYFMRDLDDNLIISGYTGSSGSIIIGVNVYPGSFIAGKFKIEMDDGRQNGACGWVVNNDGSVYYGWEYFFFYDNKDYNQVYRFYDTGDPGQSYVGAAAVYDYIEQSREFISDYDSSNSDTKVEWGSYTWPVTQYQNGVWWIEMPSQYLYDDVPLSWDWEGHNRVMHEYGHVVLDRLGFEGHPITPMLHHYIDQEHTSGSPNAAASAYWEGFADFFALAVVDNDYYEYSNGQHIEYYSLDDWVVYDSSKSCIHGELIESAIMAILWDIFDTSNSIDQGNLGNLQSDGIDDDAISGGFAYLWEVVDYWEPMAIGDFWDWWQYWWPDMDDELEEIFLKANVARYQYYDFGNSWSSGKGPNNALIMRSFEIRGMNPTIVEDQKVLVRYVLKNSIDGGPTIIFDDMWGISVAARRPPNDQNADFGHGFQNQPLVAGHVVQSTQYCTISTSGGWWSFWPWFNINDIGYGWDEYTQYFYVNNYVIYEGFEGIFPQNSPGWSCWDMNPSCGRDFWDDSSQKAYSGDWSAWCAEDGAHDYQKYDDDMESYMEYSGNLHYINLKLEFHFCQWIEEGCDYFSIEYWDNKNDNYYTVFVYGVTVGDWTHQEFDFSNIYYYQMYYPDSTNMKIQFYFYADYSVHYKGTFVDEIYIRG